MTSAEYLAKAEVHFKLAREEADDKVRHEQLRLALSYMRLAEASEKNALTDIFYETPPTHVHGEPHQQKQQQQQQQQQLKKETPEE